MTPEEYCKLEEQAGSVGAKRLAMALRIFEAVRLLARPAPPSDEAQLCTRRPTE